MKSVSTAYTESMASPLRNHSKVKVLFQNVNATAATDGVWTYNDGTSWAETTTLDYEYDYGTPYATLEHNRWALDGNFNIYPDNFSVTDGYLSSRLSGISGNFATKPVLTREFSTPHFLLGLTLTFDSRAVEWPVSITLDLYNGDTRVFTETATPSSDEYTFTTTAPVVTKAVLTFNGALPYHRARLESVIYGISTTFVNSDLTEVYQEHDVDPLSRRLPQERLTFSIIDYAHAYDPENPNGIWEYVDTNSPVSVQYGYETSNNTYEWLKADQYKLSGKPSVDRDIATFSATGLVESMTGVFYKSKLGTKTFYDMAVEVLEDAGLTPTASGGNPWVVDSSLKSMTTTAVLPIDTHMNCLQLIAHACGCKLFTDDDNIIHIEPFSVSGLTSYTQGSLAFRRIKDGSPVITKIERLKAVTVAKYSYSASTSASEIYSGETSEATAHIEFSGLAQDVNISVSGGTLVSSTVYGRAADLVMSAGTKTITVTGKPMQEASVVYTFPVAEDGEVDAEENPLITNDTMAYALAAHVMEYLKLRSTYDVETYGNPEFETGDVIGLQTRYSNQVRGLVLTNSVDFNGPLSGSLKIKVLS